MKIDSRHRCPYCGYLYQSEMDRTVFAHLLADPGGSVAVHSVVRVCPHIECGKAEVLVDVGAFPAALRGKPVGERHRIRYDLPNPIFRRRLLPAVFGGNPDFRTEQIPDTVFQDYDEACRLLEISPSASATFARRCLQNMIRLRFKVKPGKLQNEISALGALSPPVNQEVIEILDHIRKLGRFHALPDDDVRVIRDITDDAARRIIDVIEILLEDWFIAPAEHSDRLATLRLLVDKKGKE